MSSLLSDLAAAAAFLLLPYPEFDPVALRIGPIATVEDADAMLKRVDERGHHDARIVVE